MGRTQDVLEGMVVYVPFSVAFLTQSTNGCGQEVGWVLEMRLGCPTVGE